MSFTCDEAFENGGKYFPMKDTGHILPKNWRLFFRLLGVICHFSINIRIEVHFFLHWEIKGHWSRENLWEALRASLDLHMTSVLSFPNAKKSALQSLNTLKTLQL